MKIKTVKIYLAGACKNVSDEGVSWRNDATIMLQQIAEWCGKEITIIDPTKYFSYSANKHKSQKQVKEFFINKISKCDLVLVNLNDSDSSVGTGQETQAARMMHIPIIGFGTKNIYPWIQEVDCEVSFDSMHEAVDYIRDYYLI